MSVFLQHIVGSNHIESSRGNKNSGVNTVMQNLIRFGCEGRSIRGKARRHNAGAPVTEAVQDGKKRQREEPEPRIKSK